MATSSVNSILPSETYQEQYWKDLTLAGLLGSASELKRCMTKLKGWEHLRNKDGANPVLAALHFYPDLLIKSSLPQKALDLVSEKDAKGRDFWFYVLTSKKSDGLLTAIDTVLKLLNAQPPQVDAAGEGWLHYLLSSRRNPNISLGVLIHSMSSLPAKLPVLQPVLQTGSVEQQHGWVSHILLSHKNQTQADPAYNSLLLNNKLILVHRLLKLMTPDTYSKVIPELKYLGYLGSVVATIFMEDKALAIAKMLRLADQGMCFGQSLRNKDGGKPWSGEGAVPEWEALHQFLSLESYCASTHVVADLENAWRQTVLASVADPKHPEEIAETPRL